MAWTRFIKSENKVKFSKPKGTKVKAGFSWNNIGKVVDCEGDEYTLTPLENNMIRMVGKDQDHTFSARDVLSLLDVYDKQGNLINNSKDYK